MKHLDLFSGIGGFALAAQWAGIETVGFVEIDSFCQKVLRKHWPEVKIVGDIHEVTETTFERPVDVITGGFPCQPFSVAGKRKGTGDDRYLWPAMLDVIKAYEPTWVIGENVAGIIGMALEQVLSDLGNAGYETQTFVIPACAVNAPHRRDRVWVVAHLAENPLNRGNRGRRNGSEGRSKRSLQTSRPDGNASNSNHRRQAEQQQQATGDKQCSSNVTDTGIKGLQGSKRSEPIRLPGQPGRSRGYEKPDWQENWYEVAARFCRVDDGISNRVDRLKSLGNAIVPQIAFQIMRSIKEINDVSM